MCQPVFIFRDCGTSPPSSVSLDYFPIGRHKTLPSSLPPSLLGGAPPLAWANPTPAWLTPLLTGTDALGVEGGEMERDRHWGPSDGN